MEKIQTATLKSIALEHYELIPILEKYNLDFCCRGKKTLKEACIEKELSMDLILKEIKEISEPVKTQMPFSEMNVDQLISYILIHHHFYIRNSMPIILNHIEKVVTKHGDKYPNMPKVLELFKEVSADLTAHMEKEEEILFPRIKSIFATDDYTRSNMENSGFIYVLILVMELEHEKVGDMLFEIRALTHHYVAPTSACTTHRVCLDELKVFEEDLHQHVHIENNLLFPMAKGLTI